MKVIFIAPQCAPALLEIPANDYRAMQTLVGGLMSCSNLTEDVSAYYNDEGLLLGLPPNILSNGTLLVGNVFVSRVNEDGDSVDVTDADFRMTEAWLKECTRPGHFEYNYPAPQVFGGDSWEELMRQRDAAAATLQPVTVATVDGKAVAQ